MASFLPDAISHCPVQYIRFGSDQGILNISNLGFITLLGCDDIVLIRKIAPGHCIRYAANLYLRTMAKIYSLMSWNIEHLNFLQFPNKNGQPGTSPVDVRGWVDEPSPAAKDDWIEKYSDHCYLYLEVHSG